MSELIGRLHEGVRNAKKEKRDDDDDDIVVERAHKVAHEEKFLCFIELNTTNNIEMMCISAVMAVLMSFFELNRRK